MQRLLHRDGRESNKEYCFKRRVTWSAIFVALSGSWQYGFSIGSINAAHLTIKDAILVDYEARWNASVSNETVNAIWVASSAAFPVGGIFGCLLVGMMARRYGTLKSLTIGHVAAAAFSVFMALSGVVHSPEMLIIGRFGIGITSAVVATGLTVMYTVEVSPQKLRGIFGTLVAAGISLSILTSNVLGLPQLLGGSELWPVLIGLTGAPSVFFVLLRKTFVEGSKKDSKAPKEEVQLNDTVIRQENSPEATRMTSKQVLCSKALRQPLISAVVLCAAQQVTGLNGVSFNMNIIYYTAGIPAGAVPYVTIGVCAVMLLLNLIAAGITDKFGRKRLLIVGYATEAVSLLLLTVSMKTQHLSEAMPYVSVAASLGFWVGFATGPGPMTFVTIAEFFEPCARSAGVTIATVVLWCAFVITVIVTPYMLEMIKGFAFLPFGILAIVSVIFIHFRVPETKNKSFKEIQQSFVQRRAITTDL